MQQNWVYINLNKAFKYYFDIITISPFLNVEHSITFLNLVLNFFKKILCLQVNRQPISKPIYHLSSIKQCWNVEVCQAEYIAEILLATEFITNHNQNV